MKLIFKINYHTIWGQRLFVTGNIKELGKGDKEKAVEISYYNGEQWELSLDVSVSENTKLSYSYFVKDEKGRIISEWGEDRVLELNPNWSDELIVHDQWKAEDNPQNLFYTTPFKDVFFKKDISINTDYELKQTTTHVFSIRVPIDTEGYDICIVGSTDEFGNWDKSRAIPLEKISYDVYSVQLDLSEMNSHLEYKYGFYDKQTKRLIEFESGANRRLFISPDGNNKVIVNDENFIREFVKWKGAGVAIPVFSLRSKSSFGVGEFQDLKLMVDWAVKANLKLIQVLPINDTIAARGWMDSNPYAAISVFALHPIYLNLDKIGKLSSSFTQGVFSQLQEELNGEATVDYEKVLNAKFRYVKQYFTENRDSLRNDVKYQEFVKENADWLKPYAAFSFLRDINNTSDFSKWGKYSKFTKSILEEITLDKAIHFAEVEVYYFIQYHLHKQMLDVKNYAHENGVVLKGDIPIGIFRNSVDAWTTPQLFNMDMQAGAPPDDFSVTGQNWGSPTYNWKEMAKDGYSWWVMRLEKLSMYFDAIRLDHIL